VNNLEHVPGAKTTRLYTGLVCALVIVAVAARLVPGPRIIDDAFITFRYARNIVRGAGFVYNSGEYVLGTTTPLYTVLLALIGWIGGGADFPALAPLVNALADGVSVALLYVIARRLIGDRLPAFVVALLWAISPRSVAFAIAGMETSVYVMLMLGAFAAWVTSPASPHSNRPVPGFERGSRNAIAIAVLTGLAILTRPDALIWAGPLALAMVWQRWQTTAANLAPGGAAHVRPLTSALRLIRYLPWRELAISLAVLAPWLIYGTITFGSPLTRSFVAKLAAYPEPWYQALATFAVHYGIPFYEQFRFGTLSAIIGLPVYSALGIGGAAAVIRTDWRAAPLAIFPWLYAAVFAAANPPMFHWYLVPPMPLYVLCICAGVWGILQRVAPDRKTIRPVLLLSFGAVELAFSLNAWTLHPGFAQDRPAPQVAWNLPEIDQAAVGARLASLAGPHTVIAAADIGALGWASDARILDVVGLISPQSTRYYPVDPAMIGAAGFAVAPDLIFDQKPDYLMLHEDYGRNGLFKDPRFMRQYRLLAEYPIDVGHSQRLLVFERISLP
jgi:hypothetical protein